MRITLNGQNQEVKDSSTIKDLLESLQLSGKRLAVEVNLSIVARSNYETHRLIPGDQVEVVQAIGGGSGVEQDRPASEVDKAYDPGADPLWIAGKSYSSRLLTGTGKYKDLEQTRLATEAAGAQIVTVAVRRTNIGQDPDRPNLLEVLPPKRYTILPNTAGCTTAEEAIRTCRLARELLDGHNLVKLEVLGDLHTLYPDLVQTLKAAEILIKEGFEVMVYTSDDVLIAKRLEELGCVAVMPLAAPIGSGLGIRNPLNILQIVENAKVPIIVDAGVGTASDAALAMELGCAGVLMNTGIASAARPIQMASAMRKAVEAGRAAYLSGRIPRRAYGSPSSPLAGLFF